MITIREIAQQLGVSPTTVSNVINGRTAKMSEKTRVRIEKALVENHYTNENTGKVLDAALKLVSVDFCLGENKEVLTDPFCGSLLEALIREFRRYGRYVVSDSPLGSDEIIRKINARNIEGGIVLGCHPEQCAQLQARVPKPLVFIDSGDGDYDSVGLEDARGASDMTSYLIRQGHRRIAFFYDHDRVSASNQERFHGFLDVMEKRGLEFSPEDCYHLPLQKHLRYEILRQFARKKAGKEYTAAFFVCDLYAHEATNIFELQGVSVPRDISVTGFDDNIYARLSRPLLTTVRQHPEDKARVAVQLLMKRIYGEPVAVRSVHLPTELIVRESVRNIGAEPMTP
ncbi:MAG: LacI family DNA-binding transcriptional regulator [Eubacteriales bacterium]|nr:LacI family DNA-binding transcriptional regulator [Eubacteriales bacterium]